MLTKEEIATFIEESKIVMARWNKMFDEREKIAKEIEDHIKNKWQDSGQTEKLFVFADCFTDESGVDISLRDCVLKDGKLMRYDYDDGGKEALLPSDLTMMTLLEFAKKMTDELGINVVVNQDKALTQQDIKESGFGDFDGANVYFEDDLNLVKEGHVLYKGYEAGDIFLVCRRKSNNKLVIAWSTDGYGCRYNKIIDDPKEEEIEEFLKSVEQDNDNAKVREQIYNPI